MFTLSLLEMAIRTYLILIIGNLSLKLKYKQQGGKLNNLRIINKTLKHVINISKLRGLIDNVS